MVEIVKEEHRRGRPFGLGHKFAARGRIHTFHLNDLPHHQKLDVVVCSISIYLAQRNEVNINCLIPDQEFRIRFQGLNFFQKP